MSSINGEGNVNNQLAVNNVGFLCIEGKQNFGGSIASGSINANPSYSESKEGGSKFIEGEQVIISKESDFGTRMEIGKILHQLDGDHFVVITIPMVNNQREIIAATDILKYNEMNLEKMFLINERNHLLLEREVLIQTKRERERQRREQLFSFCSDYESEIIDKLDPGAGDEKDKEQVQSDDENSLIEYRDYNHISFIRSVTIMVIIVLLLNVIIGPSIEALNRFKIFTEFEEVDFNVIAVCGALILISLIGFDISNKQTGANHYASFSLSTSACSAFIFFLIYKVFDEYFSKV